MTANIRTGQNMAGQTRKNMDRARTGAGTGKGEHRGGNIHIVLRQEMHKDRQII
jgi:hypothetical protein